MMLPPNVNLSTIAAQRTAAASLTFYKVEGRNVGVGQRGRCA